MPGSEAQVLHQITRYEQQGWNVIEMEPSKTFGRATIYYACPPGVSPPEHQQQLLRAEDGPPVYTAGERF